MRKAMKPPVIVTMMIVTLAVIVVASSLGAQRAATTDRAADVRAAERGFAAAMAARDRTAFASYVADDAIFFGNQGALKGKSAVVAGWSGGHRAIPDRNEDFTFH